MDVEEKIWERKKLGLELRQKYELYFVTLIFTLLALAIQTAQPSPTRYWLWLEIGSWAFLLLAGLVSLWRLTKLWFREARVGEMFEAQWEPNDRHKQIALELSALDAKLHHSVGPYYC